MSELKSETPLSTSSASKASSANVLRSSNFVQHSKKDAQDYFKNLSAGSKPSTPSTGRVINPFGIKKTESPKLIEVKVKMEVCNKYNF